MWRTTGISVALPTKSVCQDTHLWRQLDDNTLVVTVADGAGGAPRAEYGSEIASRSAMDYVVANVIPWDSKDTDFDWPKMLTGAMEAAIKAVRAEAVAQSVPADHFATTLIVAIAMRGLVAAAQLGDGMVFIADREGAIVRLTIPQRGEYSNETNMITSQCAADKVQIAVWRDYVTGIAVMTDGLLPITTILPHYKPFSPFFTNLFAFLRSTEDSQQALNKLKSFLLSERVQSGTGDDLTLVLAVPDEMPAH
jgi:hypothetical protein